jgi:hypothetical protein
MSNRSHTPRCAPTESPRYVLLRMGGVDILVPQSQVQALESADDVQRSADDERAWINMGGARWEVFCLTADLRSSGECPAARRICVLLRSDTDRFGILCDQVTVLAQAEINILPLPVCMHTPETPVRALALHGRRVLCVTTAEDLLVCLGQEGGPGRETLPAPQPLAGRRV